MKRGWRVNTIERIESPAANITVDYALTVRENNTVEILKDCHVGVFKEYRVKN